MFDPESETNNLIGIIVNTHSITFNGNFTMKWISLCMVIIPGRKMDLGAVNVSSKMHTYLLAALLRVLRKFFVLRLFCW